MSAYPPKMPHRTRRKLAMMILRGEFVAVSDSLVQFSTGERRGRLVLGFRVTNHRRLENVTPTTSKSVKGTPRPLDGPPALGAKVVTSRVVSFEHRVEIGEDGQKKRVPVATTEPFVTVGTVIQYSRLHRDDDAVVIDWGNGTPIRVNLNELYDVTAEQRDLARSTEGVNHV